MASFTDEISIIVVGGHGGAGSVHFRHEKYVEFGGPDGGDGGKGGNVILRAKQSVPTLDHFLPDKTYQAEPGQPGAGRNQTGRQGEDLILYVPVGTQVYDKENMELLHDFQQEEDYIVAHGGRGGKGNTFFKSATLQAPKFAQPGEPGEKKWILLSLKLLADIGIVGLPNAGKSTLLSKITEAHPKIASYAFTTLVPNLGVVKRYGDMFRYVVADIPGIIEGASKGLGLGLYFLKHIERVKGILFLLDGESLHPEEELNLLKKEMESYNPKLLEKPYIIVLNKIDVWEGDLNFTKEILEKYSHLGPIHPISCEKGWGLDELLDKIDRTFFSKELKRIGIQ